MFEECATPLFATLNTVLSLAFHEGTGFIWIGKGFSHMYIFGGCLNRRSRDVVYFAWDWKIHKRFVRYVATKDVPSFFAASNAVPSLF